MNAIWVRNLRAASGKQCRVQRPQPFSSSTLPPTGGYSRRGSEAIWVVPSLHGKELSCRRRAIPNVTCNSTLEPEVPLSDLKLQLQAALSVEDYTKAARLRDAIQQLSMVGKIAVEDANERFYKAFRSGSVKEMDAVWGQGDHIQVIHPGASCIAGREEVMDSWKSVLKNVRPGAFRIDLEDVRISAGENYGVVTCVEIIDGDDSLGRICATNIFEKQDGTWVITLHHGSMSPPVKRRLRSQL